ncbi:MFS transporter [Leucobacter sp. CSA2]|uniref:MFS transporter n=1 Tax=Leucobacter edaphi TaxID=2796472 RepID=A0A934QFB6_9MICO|nr:MFS transporter [Leucobacter edaphi]MBK0422784.1 MFS transporter [Leucobacter edaphi]
MSSTHPIALPQPGPMSKARRWAALAVLSASLLVITMDMTILNIALPALAAELNPTSDQQLWIVDVYSLVLAGLLVTFAAVADRWGRKRMLMLGYLIFGGASLLVFFANSAEMVIAIRAMLGVGGAMIMPVTLSLIRIIFTNPKERATALSIWAAVSSLGAAVGPLVGGLLLEFFSWHAAFLVNVPLMFGAVIAALFIISESRVAKPGPLDVLAAALSLAGMTLVVWAIKIFGKHASLFVPEALVAFFIGAALLAWFVVRCVRSDHPLLDLKLFESRVFSAGIIAALGSTFAMIAAMLLIAQWMQLVDGATPFEAGIRMFPVAIMGAISSLAAPPLARLIGARAVQAGGLVLGGIGMLVIGVQPGTLHTATVITALLLVGAGTGSLAIGSAMIMSGSPEERAGNAGALEETSYEIGALLGVAVLGSIAAVQFRQEFAATAAFEKLSASSPELAQRSQESLGAAVAIANEQGLPEVISSAGVAFTHAMQWAGLVGAILMFAVAATTFFLTPKGTDISEGAH